MNGMPSFWFLRKVNGSVLAPKLRLGCVVGLSLFSLTARAADITLAWDPTTKRSDGSAVTNLAGYKVYYGPVAGPPYTGTSAEEGASPITVALNELADPASPTKVLHGIPSCRHLHFAVTAYATDNEESDFSNKVETTVAFKPVVGAVNTSTSGELVVTWSGKPANDSGTFSEYLLHYDVDSTAPYTGTGAAQGDSPIRVPAGTTRLTLSGLAPGTKIYVAVETRCPDGQGRLSVEVSQVTTGASDGPPDSGDAAVDGAGSRDAAVPDRSGASSDGAAPVLDAGNPSDGKQVSDAGPGLDGSSPRGDGIGAPATRVLESGGCAVAGGPSPDAPPNALWLLLLLCGAALRRQGRSGHSSDG